VLGSEAGWKIRNSDNEYTGYRTQKAAMQAAVNAARRLGRTGHDTEVRMQGADGFWETEWTYDQDSGPPSS
jgi:hypothetical protein